MRRKFPSLQLIAPLFLLLFPSLSAGQDAKSQVAAEIERLQQSLQAKPITDADLAPVASSASQNLTEASAALESGKLHLSFERLLQAENLLNGARFSLEKSEAVKPGYQAFEGQWKTISQTVASINQQPRAKDWSRSPAAVRALAGKPLTRDQLAGRVVLVEFWATWCPPCRSTLQWIGDLQRRHPDKLAVVALAVESPEDQIRSSVSSLSPDLHWAITDPTTAQAFGDIIAVTTLFLFDRSAECVRVLYGAPLDLHDQVERELKTLLK